MIPKYISFYQFHLNYYIWGKETYLGWSAYVCSNLYQGDWSMSDERCPHKSSPPEPAHPSVPLCQLHHYRCPWRVPVISEAAWAILMGYLSHLCRICTVDSWRGFWRHCLYPSDILAHNSSVSCIPKYLHSHNFVRSSPLIGRMKFTNASIPRNRPRTAISQFEKREDLLGHEFHTSQEGT